MKLKLGKVKRKKWDWESKKDVRINEELRKRNKNWIEKIDRRKENELIEKKIFISVVIYNESDYLLELGEELKNIKIEKEERNDEDLENLNRLKIKDKKYGKKRRREKLVKWKNV